jgi:hypothetical protein
VAERSAIKRSRGDPTEYLLFKVEPVTITDEDI